MNNPVISVQNLSVAFGFSKGKKGSFICKEGSPLQVTDRVSFDIYPGEFFSLVGESGCGKSVTAMGLLRLLPQPSAQIVEGAVLYGGKDLTKLSLQELQPIRGSEIACIFQEPMQALNPVLTIKKQLLETFRFTPSQKEKLSGKESRKSRKETELAEIRNQLSSAGFTDPDRVLDSYPHELSGGMLQRVCIVMALLSKPKLIIADEPTTALDVTVQAQVLQVLKRMAQETHTAVLLITHNMGIVSQYVDRVAVMYAGRIVETGPVQEIICNPLHPYTKGLLAAIPESHSDMKTMHSIPGSVPQPKDFAQGCRFAERCSCCGERCKTAELPLCKVIEGENRGGTHQVFCWEV